MSTIVKSSLCALFFINAMTGAGQAEQSQPKIQTGLFYEASLVTNWLEEQEITTP